MSIYVSILLEAQWGWSVRVPGASVGGSSLPLPPPSTLVGALANPIARLLRWGEVTVEGKAVYSSTLKLARHLEAAGARVVRGVAVLFNDPLKVTNIPYLRPSNRFNRDLWFSLQAMGAYSAPSVELEAVLVFNDSVLKEGVNEEKIEAAAWSISRLGCKEGIVHVKNVVIGEALEVTGGSTPYYAPIQSLENPDEGEVIKAWDPRDPSSYGKLGRKKPKELTLVIPKGARGAGTVGVTVDTPKQALKEDYQSYKVKSAYNGESVVAALPPLEG